MEILPPAQCECNGPAEREIGPPVDIALGGSINAPAGFCGGRYRSSLARCAATRHLMEQKRMLDCCASIGLPGNVGKAPPKIVVLIMPPQICERVLSCFMLANLAYIKNKKRGSRERSSPPCQIRILTLPRCPEARGNIFNLDLHLTRKFFRPLGPRRRKPFGSRLRTIKRYSSRRL